MARVTGIGGVFFKGRDAAALRTWYQTHLGIELEAWGGKPFRWTEGGTTVWCVFDGDTQYFGKGGSPFMINYRVADLAQVLAELRAEGCDVDDRTEETPQGKFGWVTDPEGNRVELWEPPPGE